MSSLLRVSLLPLVEIIVNLLWFHSHLQTSSVAAQFTVGSVVFADLTLTMTKDAPESLKKLKHILIAIYDLIQQ